MTLPPTLLTEVDLGSARGGRKPAKPLEVEVVREIVREDLPGIQSPPLGSALVPALREVRASHHRLAELIAKGTPGVEISAITGYSQSYISTLQHSPAFAELVDYYSTQNAAIYVDVMDRLRVLGLSTIEELQRRIDESPDKPSLRELMELVQLTVVGPTGGKATPGGSKFGPQAPSSGGPLVEIKFVGTPPQGTMVDVTPRDGK